MVHLSSGPPHPAIALCAASVAVLLLAEHRLHASATTHAHRGGLVRALAKLTASSAFLWLAFTAPPAAALPTTRHALITALLLSWLGDAFLLSPHRRHFVAGLGAFLLAHLAFTVAFVSAGVDLRATALAALAMAGVAVLVLRWLRPHLPAEMRIPVVAYVATIGAMVALAAGHGVADGKPWVPLGAILFAASDVFVARQQFVVRGFVNPAWGLPLYYAAQCILALSMLRAA